MNAQGFFINPKIALAMVVVGVLVVIGSTLIHPAPPLSNFPPVCSSSSIGADATNQPVSLASNNPLIQESQQAILSTGISEEYFNQHFTFLCAYTYNFNTAMGSVDWTFKVGEFALTVWDGYATNAYNNETNHSVKAFLKNSHEINNVISWDAANQKMIECIGPYTATRFQLSSVGAPVYTRTTLFMNAQSQAQTDGGKSRLIGYIDLETGECFSQNESFLTNRPIFVPLN